MRKPGYLKKIEDEDKARFDLIWNEKLKEEEDRHNKADVPIHKKDSSVSPKNWAEAIKDFQ